METENRTINTIHHGRNLKRLREAKGIKQEAMAQLVDLTQSSIARIEGKELIDDEMLKKFADVLQIPIKIIKDLKADPATIIIENNTFENGSGNFSGEISVGVQNNNIDRIMELCNEKNALYERMLELEKEKIAMLEKMLSDKSFPDLSQGGA